MVRSLKPSNGASVPLYPGQRRVSLMLAQGALALFVIFPGLGDAEALPWCLVLAAAMVAGIPGLYFGLEWARRLCFVSTALLATPIGIMLILTLFGPEPLSSLCPAVMFTPLAAHLFWLGHRETRDELARVRERRRAGIA